MIRKKIIESLTNIGVYVEEENIALSEIIDDSITFISFILGIEETFNVEIPDEMLTDTKIKTIDDVCNIVESLIDNNIAVQ